MKKIFYSLLLSIVAIQITYAQADLSDANITGHVLSTEDDEHLPFVTIRLLNTSIGTTTDATGHFFLKNIPQGKYQIEASCVGYLPQTYDVNVSGNKTQEVNFELKPDMMNLEQVVVTGNKSEVKRRTSSSLVNVLGVHIFDMVSGASLAAGLSFHPGVRVEND